MSVFVKRLTITAATMAAMMLSYIAINEGIRTPESASIGQQPAPPALKAPSRATKAELLMIVNEERAKVGVSPLVIDERLNQSAQRKADDMVRYGYFGHVSPNDGRDGYEYANDTGIACIYVGENIRQNTELHNDSFTAVRAWMKSKPHKEALLSPKHTLTGFGINGVVFVEHFCQQ